MPGLSLVASSGVQTSIYELPLETLEQIGLMHSAPPATVPLPARQAAKIATRHRVQATRSFASSSKKFEQIWQRYVDRDPAMQVEIVKNAINHCGRHRPNVFARVGESLGWIKPQKLFQKKLANLLLKLADNYCHYGVNFSTLDPIQARIVLEMCRKADLRHVRTFYLDCVHKQNPMDAKMDVESLMKALPDIGHPDMDITLDLEHQPMTHEDCKALGAGLRGTWVRTLILRNTLPDSPRGVSDFFGGWRDCPVTNLDLSLNKLSAKMQELADGVRSTSLIALDVSSNEIDADSVATLVDALPSSLKTLDMGKNLLKTGAVSVLDMLEQKGVEELNLSWNCIADESAAAIAAALQGSAKLVKLNLEGNSIGASGAVVIAEVLRSAKCLVSLREIDLRNNFIEAEGAAALRDAQKACGQRLRILYSEPEV